MTNPIPITTSLQTGNISRLSVQPIAEEFTPGAGEGVYGVEPGFVPGPTSATASIKPTDMFFEPKNKTLRHLILHNFVTLFLMPLKEEFKRQANENLHEEKNLRVALPLAK